MQRGSEEFVAQEEARRYASTEDLAGLGGWTGTSWLFPSLWAGF